jgi:hypothetical protein
VEVLKVARAEQREKSATNVCWIEIRKVESSSALDPAKNGDDLDLVLRRTR